MSGGANGWKAYATYCPKAVIMRIYLTVHILYGPVAYAICL
uniref:Uncharacterized protein n=1 Tax=Anguilla anguilla TaxID=7936 RepID=A0A0E9UMT4_ANGAN